MSKNFYHFNLKNMINKNKNNFIIIETTTPAIDLANKISKILLDQKIAGCIEFQESTSNYFWQGKISKSTEIILKIKTQEKFFDEICQIIKKNHSYEIPQIISTKINNIDESYSDWLISSLRQA
jgi:periplasmic divalent cation tolerance protein